jgi:uncharacterized membrane protein YdbT with pleckstrin-like domain
VASWERSVPLLGWLSGMRDARVRRRLLRVREVEEDIADEVHHHWVVHILEVLEVVAAALLLVLFAYSSPKAGWVILLLSALVLAHAAWRWLAHYMDVFVVTNLRVFRISGVLSTRHASTPLGRILDITVEQPVLGRILNYGHLRFESAAQEQGLRDIRFIKEPLQRDQTIQGLQMELLRRSRFDRRL